MQRERHAAGPTVHPARERATSAHRERGRENEREPERVRARMSKSEREQEEERGRQRKSDRETDREVYLLPIISLGISILKVGGFSIFFLHSKP